SNLGQNQSKSLQRLRLPASGRPWPAPKLLQNSEDSGLEKAGALVDGILAFMKQHDIPLTRENYLDVAYLGNPPEELSAEEEAELPEEFQVWETDEEDCCPGDPQFQG